MSSSRSRTVELHTRSPLGPVVVHVLTFLLHMQGTFDLPLSEVLLIAQEEQACPVPLHLLREAARQRQFLQNVEHFRVLFERMSESVERLPIAKILLLLGSSPATARAAFEIELPISRTSREDLTAVPASSSWQRDLSKQLMLVDPANWTFPSLPAQPSVFVLMQMKRESAPPFVDWWLPKTSFLPPTRTPTCRIALQGDERVDAVVHEDQTLWLQCPLALTAVRVPPRAPAASAFIS
eukprot:m.366834 g.366834  ORF g.366834 m.366834 type:complete len:238 (-) comp56069_c1_seq35:1869-2582(-)